MQNFTYPQSDLDNGTALLRVLGSFWAKTYGRKDQLRTYTQAVAAGAGQTQLNLLETVAALSRFEIPVFHTENWYPLTLKKSQLNDTTNNLYKFDTDNLVFDQGLVVQFDAQAARDFYSFPAPASLVSATHIFDRVLFPNFALAAGTDFKIDSTNQAIVFTENPFNTTSVTRQPIYAENGALVDEEITLWVFKAAFDYQYVFTQFAYAINAQLKSSEGAKALINAIFDGLVVGGASAAVLDAALAAICDIPTAAADGEVVETIARDGRGVFIATDKNLYRFSEAAEPVVTAGQTLHAGDKLTNAIEIVHLNRGVVPDSLTALALDNGYTAACFYGDLIFENKEVAVSVDTAHPSGYTYVSFPVAGFPADVRHFFDELHQRGVSNLPTTPQNCDPADAKRKGTLAHILDRRTNPFGEPDATDLPTTINPLKFLVQNVLRNNAFVVTVRVSGLGKNHLGLYNIRHVRQLLPPYSAMFLIYNVDGKKDAIDGNLAVAEDITRFKGMAPKRDNVAANLVRDAGIIVRKMSGICQ
jgi:hypothetical protein